MSISGKMRLERAKRLFLHNWRLYTLLIPALIWLVVFCYYPMYGVTIAFKNYKSSAGIWGSEWVGFKWFEMFLSQAQSGRLIKNTFLLSLYGILAGFPLPIVFALLLNQLNFKPFKKFVQTVSFAPHFISVVVVVSMINLMLAPNTGIINNFLKLFVGEAKLYTVRPEYFRSVFVISGLWTGTGFGAIVYIAALAGVSPELHEAAIVDGATRFQRIRYIDIPSITPTMVIMFILALGNIMSLGHEKAYLMQNSMNASVSEIISTYTYKVGLLNNRYSLSTAIGLFNSVINIIILSIVNFVMKRLTDTSLF